MPTLKVSHKTMNALIKEARKTNTTIKDLADKIIGEELNVEMKKMYNTP